MRRPQSLEGAAHSSQSITFLDALLVALVALLLRLLYLAIVAGDDSFWEPVFDERYYIGLAHDLLAGRSFAGKVFERGPLGTIVTAGVLWLSHDNIVIARIITALLGSCTAPLVGLLGARLFGRPAGIVAGLLYGAASSPILFDCRFGAPLPMIPLMVASLLMLEQLLRLHCGSSALATGLFLGLAATAHPTALAVGPVSAVAAWMVGRQRFAGLFLAGFVFPVLPVTLHNTISGRDPVLISSTGGVNFYMGNSAEADGHSTYLLGPMDSPQYGDDGAYAEPVISSGRYAAKIAVGHDLRPSEVSRYWTHRALRWILSHPSDWLRLMARKAYVLTNGYEVGQMVIIPGVFARWRAFTLLPRWWWLFPLGIAGLLLPGDPRPRVLLLAWGISLGSWVVAFFVVERFRVPLYPVLCILGARVLVELPRLFRRHAWGILSLGTALVASLVFWTRSDLIGFSIPERVALLVVRARTADAGAAEQMLLEALTLDSRSKAARSAYVGLLLGQGREAEARALGGW